jgi:hypothetical protein
MTEIYHYQYDGIQEFIPIDGANDLRDLCTTLATRKCHVTEICVSWDYEETNGVGYRAELGSALMTNNTSVTYLHLQVRGLLSRHQENTSKELQPLLHFIATSQELRDVILFEGGQDLEDLTARILQSMALNSNITEFTVHDDLYASPQSFAHFLTTAPFLRKLMVDVEAFEHCAADDLAVFGTVLEQNQTLQELHLYSSDVMDDDGSREIGELVQMYLGSHANHLRVLRLSIGIIATISQFLALSTGLNSARKLSHLQMENYVFELDCMEIFLAALKSNKTVTALTFHNCRMEKGPFDMLAQFLKSDDGRILSLQFKPTYWRHIDSAGNTLAFGAIGMALLELLRHSSVCSLELDTNDDVSVPSYALLFDGMTCHESEIRLSKLAIRALDQAVVTALARFLPHSSRLQELSTSHLLRETNYRLLLSAIRQNGSLHRVEEEVMPVVDRVWQKFVSAYCQRNKLVPKLLAQSQNVIEGTDDNESVTLDLCIIPTILFVAQQARRMAPNNILIALLGVLCSDDAVGPLQVARAHKKCRAVY